MAIYAEAAMIWRIEGGKGVMYLAGSVHLLREKDTLPDAYFKIYEEVDSLVFEVDPSQQVSPASALRMIQLGSLPSGQNLSELISSQDYQRLEKKMSEAGIPSAAYDRFRPWLAAMTLTRSHLDSMGAKTHFGLEHRLLEKSKADRKPFSGLESLDEVMRVFGSLSNTEETLLLMETLNSAHHLEENVDALINAWQRADVKALDQLIWAGAQDDPILHRILIERNKKWLEKIVTHLESEKRVMVVVGAAHLIGKGSLIDLLAQRGYSHHMAGGSP
ncbi:MAG: TraB/GumN family protein [Candidatus Methylacidiphilales bacterium]